VELDYPALYRERMKDRPGGAYKPYFHFVTNVKTRESIIACMNEALLTRTRNNEPRVIIHCEELIDEMIDFASIGGRMEGQGNNDDGVMSSMIGLYCALETSTHLKIQPESTRVSEAGELSQYVVYDHLRRQRGLYSSHEMAEAMIKDRPGWRVEPVMICHANTLYSPIFDGTGAEHELRFKYGMQSQHILPDVVAAYRDAVAGPNARPGRAAVNEDPDW
jgi:hypothetical protein